MSREPLLVGIDLGSTNSALARVHPRTGEAEIIPAFEGLGALFSSSVEGFAFRKYQIAESPEIATALLRFLRAEAELSLEAGVDGARLAIPDNFEAIQRQALESAARQAGFTQVELIENSRCIVEAYGLGQGTRTLLLVHLGSKDEAAKTAVVNAPEAPARARALGGVASMEVDEPFDRAWRRVGLALDRSGYTVEDRDRSAGLFYVRYVDPKVAGLEEPNFFARLFGAKGPDRTPVRYRVALKGEGTKTTVAVQSSAGAPEAGDAGKAIVAQLVRELR